MKKTVMPKEKGKKKNKGVVKRSYKKSRLMERELWALLGEADYRSPKVWR